MGPFTRFDGFETESKNIWFNTCLTVKLDIALPSFPRLLEEASCLSTG